MRSGWLLFIALFLVVLGAFALRAPQLELRPMHGDEAVHAIKFRDLWTQGQYAYDPQEYHGPTLYDFALPVVAFANVPDFPSLTAATLRIVPVIFGTMLISLLWLLHDGFGERRWTVFWAALLTALSPLFVFYARYFIQETLLVCFTLGFIACLWRAREQHNEQHSERAKIGWRIGAGAFAGLMMASKETALIAFACIAFAWFFTLREKSDQRENGRCDERVWLWPTLTAVSVAALLFSNFGRRPQGALDALLAFGTYFTRAGLGATTNEVQGDLHRHPWFQYLEWLLWYHPKAGPRWTEIFAAGLFIIGLICVVWSLFKRDQNAPLARFFTVYALSMFLIYSAIPYKTPWCAMGFWQGALIIAGFGAAQLLHGPLQVLARWPIAARLVQLPILAILGIGCWQLYGQVQLSNTRLFADGRNPWVYAHPTRDVIKLEKRINDLVAFSAQKSNTPILVVAPGGDYWPLPWSLRAQNQVGYFETVPALKGAKPELMIVAQSQSEAAQKALGPNFEENYHNEFYGLRRKVVFALYVKKELWDKFLATR